MNKLTAKQKMFIKEYLIDMNGTQAAIRAGYSEDTAQQIASENLLKPLIKEKIDEELSKRAKKLDITAEWVLTNLKTIAERCMQAEEVQKYDNDFKMMIGTGEYKFDSGGANKSLELIGKHLKMFTDKQEVEATVSVKYEELLKDIK